MADGAGGGQDGDMRARLDKLSRDIDARNAATAAGKAKETARGPDNIGSAMSMGFRVMSEFVAAVVVSAILGWAGDHWLGTSPLFLITFVALGTAAGFWSVYRTATRPTGLPGRR